MICFHPPAFAPRPSPGFALVSALFLMIVLAGLGAILVTVSSVQHTTYAQQAQAARTYYAARAGLEWATQKSVMESVAAGGGCPLGASNFTLAGGFDLEVTCARASHALPAGVRVPYYTISAEARSGSYGSTDFASRSVQGKVIGTP